MCWVQYRHRNFVMFSWNPVHSLGSGASSSATAFLEPEYFRVWRVLLYAEGWCHWVVPGWLCVPREKFPGAKESQLCHKSPTVLTPFFLHDDLGENECWQLTGTGQCLEESRETCYPTDKGMGSRRGEQRRLVHAQPGIRSHRWTKGTCPTNSSSFLLKIRSRFIHLFSSWVQT